MAKGKKTPPARAPRKPPEPSRSELSAFVQGEGEPEPKREPEPAEVTPRRSTPKKQVYLNQPEKVAVYLQPELAKLLRVHAASEGASVSYVVQEALRRYFESINLY